MIDPKPCSNPECKLNGMTTTLIRAFTKSDKCVGCLLEQDWKNKVRVEELKPARKRIRIFNNL